MPIHKSAFLSSSDHAKRRKAQHRPVGICSCLLPSRLLSLAPLLTPATGAIAPSGAQSAPSKSFILCPPFASTGRLVLFSSSPRLLFRLPDSSPTRSTYSAGCRCG
ncbi:hypothetical protein L596_023158 [Steinernema carpocapsae]|uniref:Uncharacterized protein n=1 Tax=Steinernema carpocapsae TaxID=34508 RepID=A0A4U5MCT7_STECR|nr:hypothetical protein L596_023158 [Steinernema carpocapsae]